MKPKQGVSQKDQRTMNDSTRRGMCIIAEGFVMALPKNLAVIGGTAIAYFLVYEINAYLFSSLAYARDVYWVFLPSGLQLAFILVFVEQGAIGIALATTLLGFLYQPNADLSIIVGTGFLAGFAPWLARLICIDKLRLDENLKNLTSTSLLAIALVFSLLPPVLLQLLYSCCGLSNDFVVTTAVMFTGALIGTFAMLYLAKAALHLYSFGSQS